MFFWASLLEGINSMYKFIRNFTFIAISVMFSYAQATVYSWVDEDGNTHYSDTPSDVSAEEVDVQIHSVGASIVRDQTSKEQSQSKDGQQNEKKGPPSNNQGGEQGEQVLPIMGDGDIPPPPAS
jgi:hypothetical protein